MFMVSLAVNENKKLWDGERVDVKINGKKAKLWISDPYNHELSYQHSGKKAVTVQNANHSFDGNLNTFMGNL